MSARSSLRETRGLTLIELVAAMAVFALVAVMGLQALTGMLRLRDRLSAEEAATGRLSYAAALLRRDLGAAVPILFHAPNGRAVSSLDLSRDGRTLSLSIAGQDDLPPVQGLGLHRVEWRFDGNGQRLLRRVWPVLSPAAPSAAQPEVEILTGVTGFEVRTYWRGVGWRDGSDSGQPRSAPTGSNRDGDRGPVAQSSYSDTLPLAVELRLGTVEFGQILMVESLL